MPWKMLRIVAVLATAGLVGSCSRQRPDAPSAALNQPAPSTTLPGDGVVDPSLVADYYTGDGLGYNVVLSLRDDGTFVSKWTGCLGEYGHANGRWARSADRVSFVSSHATGMLQNYLRGATVV